jgi:hypothetical protein
MCRIGRWSDDDEIVVHHVETPDATAFGHEFFLGPPVVDEHHVSIAAPADIKRLSGANCYHFHLDAGLRGKAR